MNLPFSRVGDGIIIQVKVIPMSSKNEVIGIDGNIIKVKLTAPPVEGAANEQLIEFMSEILGVKKSSIQMIRGFSGRNKILKIRGVNL